MATGVNDQTGGVMSPSDVHFAGADAWAQMTGVSPMSPLVGGPGQGTAESPAGPYTIDGHASRIVTNDAAPIAGITGPGSAVLDDWRDVLNFKGSPAPWLLLLLLVMLGFMQLRVQARAGKAHGNVAIG